MKSSKFVGSGPAAFMAALCLTGSTVKAQSIASRPSDALARDVFKQLIEIDTTDSVGSVTAAARAMEARLRGAGFDSADLNVVGPNDRKMNLVARFRGTGRHPAILFIGHLDVVEARVGDWTTNPFEFVEKDGYFYGRGTQDMKDSDATMVVAFMRLKREGFKPDRDIILALTADEEGGKSNGVDWLYKNRRALIEAPIVINMDDYSVSSDHGRPLFYQLAATQKVYADFELSTFNPGGHSSLPPPDNAIYELADGIARLSAYHFPIELNNVTRPMLEGMAKLEPAERAADLRTIASGQQDSQAADRLSHDVYLNAVMRTTCVATRLDAGHANNALPQRAHAVVNCRILPGHSPEETRQTLVRVIADKNLTVKFLNEQGETSDIAPDNKGFAPPPIPLELMKPLTRLVAQFWPGIPIIPTLSPGASDDVFVNAAGLPSYTVTGFQLDRDNERAHGQDERIGVESFYVGNEFIYRYIKALTSR